MTDYVPNVMVICLHLWWSHFRWGDDEEGDDVGGDYDEGGDDDDEEEGDDDVGQIMGWCWPLTQSRILPARH